MKEKNEGNRLEINLLHIRRT